MTRPATASKPAAPITLEALLTRREGFDLDASPLQRAITRAADGRPIGDLLDDAACLRHFGCGRDAIGRERPSLVVVIAGVRSGKTLLADAASVASAITADLSKLKPHEVARVPVVAPTVDNADATFRMLIGHTQAAPALSPLIVGKPTSDTIVLRRPDGRQVEIVVVAASRGAITLRSRWLAGFVFDEAALFGEEAAGAVVTAEELLRAGETRLVKGAQGWIISSPWGPQGLLWEMHKLFFGKPGRVLVVHAPTLAMNPSFDSAQVEAIRARDPDTAAREYDAAWLDASTSLLSASDVDRCTRRDPLVIGRERGHSYAGAMDAATRGNSWTFVIKTRKRAADGAERDVIVKATQWTGSKAEPLDPKAVLGEIARDVQAYGLEGVDADAYGSDFLRQLAFECGVEVRMVTMTAEEKLDRYLSLATRVRTGEIEFPADAVMRRDLLSLRKVARQGSVRIELPATPDGRHADYCPAVCLVAHRRVEPPALAKPILSPDEQARADEDALRRRFDARRDPFARLSVDGLPSLVASSRGLR